MSVAASIDDKRNEDAPSFIARDAPVNTGGSSNYDPRSVYFPEITVLSRKFVNSFESSHWSRIFTITVRLEHCFRIPVL